MRKKIRRRLKTDEFATLMNQVFDFFKKNQREFMIAGAAVVFIALIFLGVKYIQAVNQRNESQLLGRILTLEEEIKDNPEKLAELESLAGSGKFERLAAVKAASEYFSRGQADKALSLLRGLSFARKDLIAYQARDLIGQIYYYQKDYDRALEIFDTIEREDPDVYPMDIVLYRKAQILTARNDIQPAIDIYQKLQADYPGSYFGYEAQQEIQKLEDQKLEEKK
jgi:predicted negative regulator of RcsB-dependent stress response